MINSDEIGPLMIGSFAASKDLLPSPENFELPEVSPSIIGDDTAADPAIGEIVCILNYRRTGPFDTEMDFVFDTFAEESCSDEPTTLYDYNLTGPGDRSYLTVEVRTSAFHQPIRFRAERVTSP